MKVSLWTCEKHRQAALDDKDNRRVTLLATEARIIRNRQSI